VKTNVQKIMKENFQTPQYHVYSTTSQPFFPVFHCPEKPISLELVSIIGGQSKGKGKAVLLQAWCGPEGSRKLRFPHFMTTAQTGGKVASLYPQEIHLVLISGRG
jgi:hypothetical protein